MRSSYPNTPPRPTLRTSSTNSTCETVCRRSYSHMNPAPFGSAREAASLITITTVASSGRNGEVGPSYREWRAVRLLSPGALEPQMDAGNLHQREINGG